jgi:hypothetical protein
MPGRASRSSDTGPGTSRRVVRSCTDGDIVRLMDETHAEQVVVDRLLGPRAVPLRLHQGDFVDEAEVAELVGALAVLVQAYRGRPTVPKQVALALVDISARFENRYYSHEQQERLEDIAHELQRLAENLFDPAT